ncbi:hypothetical protein R50073_36500 [Maricurvus nonylphenolicus]|uniref:acyl carrier protein n=1 Tax=Maricurvus nonylphenolicus TaxID=1008307 RepID=UPI0036F263AE
MDRNEIFNTIVAIINKSLPSPVSVSLEDDLREDIGLDSIGFVELGTGLEEIYQIDIDDADLEGFKTVEEVVNAVINSPTYA